MAGNKKVLVLFTRSYPFGNGEEFIHEEVLQLSNYFEKIHIIPLEKTGKIRSIPFNVSIINLNFKELSKINKADYFLFFLLTISNIRYFFQNNFIIQLSSLKSFFLKSYLVTDWINKHDINYIKGVVFYSYWFDEWATILSILKKKKIIEDFISKIHGFDLYEFRYKSNKIPFRKFQLKHVLKLFFISQDGMNYLTMKYPKFSKKYFVSYLGSKDFGELNHNFSDVVTILTVSRIDHNKQLLLLIEILKKVNTKIVWIHYGSGSLQNEFLDKSLTLPKNVSLNFKGQKDHDEMMYDIIKQNIDVFLNVSKHEGLPVSMMEVLSLGIPIFATDVGGVREIVNDEIGILYEQERIFDIVSDLNSFKVSKFNDEKTRKSCRKVWENNFDSRINYRIFASKLLDYFHD